jgi:hypothetical protein
MPFLNEINKNLKEKSAFFEENIIKFNFMLINRQF